MTSKRAFELLDFERDLPTTEEDVAALRRVRRITGGREPWRLMQELHDALPPAARKPRTRTSAGYEPFEL